MTTDITLSELALIGEWSKQHLTSYAKASVAELAENGEDVLTLLSLAAKLEHYAGEVKKAAKEAGLEELARYGREGVAKSGVKLLIKEVGVNYSYERDSVWVQRMADVDAANTLLADWEQILKKMPPEGMIISDPETGELYRAYPPVKTARESIQATIL